MALVGLYAVGWGCANRAGRSLGYASSDHRSLSANVLVHLRPAPPKKEGADVRYGSKPDIERSEQDNAKPRYNGDECDGNNG